jgi:hypothetical protein
LIAENAEEDAEDAEKTVNRSVRVMLAARRHTEGGARIAENGNVAGLP